MRLAVFKSSEISACCEFQFDLRMDQVKFPQGRHDKRHDAGQGGHYKGAGQLPGPPATAAGKISEHFISATDDVQHFLTAFSQRVAACMT